MISGITRHETNQNISPDSFSLQKEFRPDIPEQSERGRSKLIEFLHGKPQKDNSSEEGIQGQASLGLIASTSQKESNIGIRVRLRQFLLMLGNAIPHHTYIDAASHSLKVAKIPRASGGDFQLSLWEPEPSTTDAEQKHADLILYPHIRWILEQPAVISHWDIGEAFQPLSSGAESPTVAADLERADENAVLNEIFAQLDAVFRWREDWNEEEHEPEKPSEHAIDRAKQVVSELLGAVISKGKPLHTPAISYDYDGYINMVWRNGKHELYLEVNEDEIEYVKVWGANIDSEMDAGIPNKDNYLTLWECLLDG